MFCVRGASRALRAEHENAEPRRIAFGDWERGAVAGFEAPLHPSPPPRTHPPGYAEVPRHENRTKSHERTACQARTMSFTPAARAFSPVLGCAKSFVTFRETFVSRRAAETPEGWRLRERQRPSSLEPSDARADSNRPSGRFRGGAGFRGSREAPRGSTRFGASRGTRKRGTSANRLRRLGARSRRRVRSSASPVAASTFPPSGLCRSPATRKSHKKSRKNCLPGTDH